MPNYFDQFDPQPQQGNYFDQFDQRPQPTAQENIVNGSFSNPEEAASAVDTAKKVGIAPTIVQLDLDKYKRDAARQEALDSLTGRDALQTWVQQHEMNGRLSFDDMPALARAHDAAQYFNKSTSTAGLWEQISKNASEHWNAISMLPTDEERTLFQNWGLYRRERNEGILTLPRVFDELLIGGAISPIVRAGAKTLSGGMGALEGLLDWSVDHGLPRDFAGILHGEYIPPGPTAGMSLAEATPSKAGKLVQTWVADQLSKVPDSVPFRGRVSVKSLTTGEKVEDVPQIGEAAKQALREGETPRPGLDPVTDAFHVMQVEHDSAALDELMNRVAETKLRERSPEALKGLLEEITGGQNIYIPSQAVRDLYRGKDVHPQDGILGWMDRGPEKISNSVAAGTDLQVPMAEFVSHVDPAVYSEIKDQIKFRDTGVSVEEAKALDKMKPEDYEQEKTVSQKAAEVEAEEEAKVAAEKEGGEKPSEPAPQPEQQTPKVVGGEAAAEETKPPLRRALEESLQYLETKLADTDGGAGAARELYASIKDELAKMDELEKKLSGNKPPPQEPGQPPGGPAAPFRREKKFLYLNALLQNGKALGIDETRFAQYSRKVAAQDNASYQKILDREVATAKRRLAPEWGENLAKIREEVEIDLRSSPQIIADRFIRDGELPTGEVLGAQKLDSDVVKQIVGEPLPRYTKKGGLHPSDVAPMLGFRNGTELALALWENEKLMKEGDVGPKTFFKQLVDKEADRRMEIAHGELSENILDEARELAMAEPYIDILVDDLRELYKISGNAPLTKDVLMADAERRFAAETATDVSFEKFRRSAEKNGVEAEKALLKGNIREAVQAKQDHFYSVAFAKMARRFERSMGRAESTFEKLAKNESRGSVDQDYWDNARNILSDLGFTKEQFQRPLKDLNEIIYETSGAVQVAPWLTNPAGFRDIRYSNLSVEEFNALDKSIRSILNAGADVKFVDSVRGRAELDNVVHDIGAELGRFNLKLAREHQSFLQRRGANLRAINAWNILVERIFDYTDQFNPHGPITSYIDRPLRDAFSREKALEEKIVNRLKKLEEYTDSGVHDPIDNRVVIDPLTVRAGGSNGQLLPMTRHNLRIMMLHLGTASSTEKLIGGWGITEKDAWDLVRNNATANDIKWVNGMHELFNFLGDEAAPMIRRVTGVEFERLPPSPMAVKLRDGETHELTGGYAPINYDKHRGNVDNSHQLAGDLFDKNYFTSLPVHSYTQERTGIKAFVDPHGMLMKTKIKQMVHDIAFREAVLNAQKVLRHPDFRKAMIQGWGEEYADLLPGWLRDIANTQNADDELAQGAANIVAHMRQAVTSTLINFNPGTVIKHGGTALGMSAMQANPRNFFAAMKDIGVATKDIGIQGIAQAVGDLLKSQKGAVYDEDLAAATRQIMLNDNAYQFVLSKSANMRTRTKLYTDTIGGAYEAASGELSTAAKIRAKNDQFGRFAVQLSDMASAFPMWVDAYKKAIQRGAEDADAVFEADRSVARAHGSSFYGDKPAIMRLGGNSFGGQIVRTFTQLFGFFNHQFNNGLQWMWDIAAKARGQQEPGANIPAIAWRMFTLGVIPIALEELAAPALSKDQFGGYGEHALRATMVYLGSMYPFVRDFTNAKFRGAEPSSGMIGAGYRMVSGAINELSKPSRNAIAHALTAISLATGIGSAQVGRTVQGAEKQLTGQERPRTFEEYRALYRKGYIRPRQ